MKDQDFIHTTFIEMVKDTFLPAQRLSFTPPLLFGAKGGVVNYTPPFFGCERSHAGPNLQTWLCCSDKLFDGKLIAGATVVAAAAAAPLPLPVTAVAVNFGLS